MTNKFYESKHIESNGTHPESGEPYTVIIFKRPDCSLHGTNVYDCYLSRFDYPLSYMFGIPENQGLLYTIGLAHANITDYWQEG